MRRKVSFSRFLKTGSSKQELLCAIGLAQSSFVARELFTRGFFFCLDLAISIVTAPLLKQLQSLSKKLV